MSDIPVLGRLFGTTDKNRDRQELIVLITPTVIRGGEDAKNVDGRLSEKIRIAGATASIQCSRHADGACRRYGTAVFYSAG